MAKKKNITEKDLTNWYMDYVLEHGDHPKTVYAFAKMHNFEESKFYKHFGSFEAIEKSIFEGLFASSITVLEANEDYQIFDARNKLLSFYYTFFENLTANRSYIKYSLENYKGQLKGMKVLSGLRKKFTDYISSLGIPMLGIKNQHIENIQERAIKQSAWMQLLLTMKFWLEDTSASFEKTDIFIEKSVNTTFDILNVAPIKSVLDFGKFLYKERFQMN